MRLIRPVQGTGLEFTISETDAPGKMFVYAEEGEDVSVSMLLSGGNVQAETEVLIQTQVSNHNYEMPMVVELRQQNVNTQEWEVITSQEMSREGFMELNGTAINSTPFKLVFSAGGYSNASFDVHGVDYYILDVVTHSYTYIECNRDQDAEVKDYRFGFNGKHKDNEIAGLGNHLDYGLRGYDPRRGQFWSVDPLASKFPWWSPYQFSGLNPIRFNDLDGAEPNNPFTRYLLTDAAVTLTQQPTSAKAKVYGAVIGMGGAVQNLATGTMNMFLHPVETGKGMMRMASQSPTQNAVDYGVNMAQQYGSLPQGGAQESAVYSNVATDVGMMFLPFKFKASPAAAEATQTFRFIKGAANAERTAIIGQGMDRVHGLAAKIKNSEVFKPSSGALKEWNKLLEKSNGAQLSDEVVQGTQLYQENQAWIQGVKEKGYNIVDMGADGSGKQSTFYNMEQSTVYGSGE